MNSNIVSAKNRLYKSIFCSLRHLIFIVLFLPVSVAAQFFKPADSLSKPRVVFVTATGLGVYGTGMVLLGRAWYEDNLTRRFHFFNDNGEWLQVDKVGHVFSAYNESLMVSDLYRWAGVHPDKAAVLGLVAGFVGQTSIEIFDGFADKWGFSWGDMGANLVGLGFFGLQHWAWDEQRIYFKVSSDLRSYPIDLLTDQNGVLGTDHLQRRATTMFGAHPASRFLKDYNAQTNWLSVNPSTFSQKKDPWWPQWLNIAVGYSAENMFGGFGNSWNYEGHSYRLSSDDYPRYRQYLLSFDIDMRRVPVRSPFLRTLLHGLNMLKVPAPTLEYNKVHGLKWHWLYF